MELDWKLLRSVSRSFYISLRFLPEEVRGTLALAYLLARASDTLADAGSEMPLEGRLRALRAYSEGKWDAACLAEFPELRPEEKSLLDAIPNLFLQLEVHPDADLIKKVLGTIVSGQILDVERSAVKMQNALTAEELDDYTYRVAGCVGEFWTRLCFRRLSRVTALSEEEMVRLGIEYGKGLQLVNILRDYAEDALNGRKYFLWEQFDDVFNQAKRWLESGRRYASALRGFRLRFCSRLPYELAEETLALIRQYPGMRGVRISRSRVYLAAGWGVLDALGGCR